MEPRRRANLRVQEGRGKGRTAHELIVPPDARAQVDRVWAALLAGDTSSHSINRNVRKDGGSLMCEWFNTPLLDSRGKVHGVASMAMDVSDRERIESRLREAQKMESLGVLASGVAHDFNSLLMIMSGNVELMRLMKGMPPEATARLNQIEDAGRRGGQLIKHLLTYARTGRHNPQPNDLNEIIKEGMNLVRASLAPHHELVLQLAPKPPPILADRNQVEQIIINLCINAKEAMPEGGTIRLVTRATHLTTETASRCVPYDGKPGDYMEMVVSDVGRGMTEETRARIFDPFFTTKADGHGLGLAAVLGILRQHRAVALVESTLGEGTDFHVFFPRMAGRG